MRLLDLAQGSPEWLAAREQFFCASEAPIIMGVSRHMKRTEFLTLKATGQQKEFSEWVKRNLLEKGHEAEARARPLVEAIIGEDLYPVVGVSDCGKYLASFDGLTMDESTGFEHKLISAELIRQFNAAELDEEYVWQLEHQALVAGLERIVFVASDGTEDRLMHMIYVPSPERQKRLIAGWQQFEEDLKNYQHVEVIQAPVAKPVASLPTLYVEITGEVAASNLAAYKEAALAMIESVNTDLQTDQDFADAESMVKFFDEAEKKVRLIKEQSLQKTASIAEAMKTMDDLADAMRTKRLFLNKHVTERKNSIRAEIIAEGTKAWATHVSGLNERLGRPYMTDVRIDFAGAIKGKRTIASLRDAVQKALLDGKLEANATADRIAVNLKQLTQHAEHAFLFKDEATLVQMEPAAFSEVVEGRIAKHQAEQARKEAETRERIRKEEEAKAAAKAKAEADALAEQAREKIRAEERAKAEAAAKQREAQRPAQVPYPKPTAKKEPPPRPAPPADEILMLVAEKYSVPKTLAGRWLHELFSKEPA